MTEAIFGLVGVFIGAGISWLQVYWTNKRTENKNARYLAIRIVCVLDKYLEHCAEVIKDDGLSFGQRTEEGHLAPQVIAPGPPIFPEDVDWRSIDHELMYKILSFPTEVETGERLIKSTLEFASPPDFEDWFDERKYQYCLFGLTAYQLSGELAEKYSIKKMVYNHWDPVNDLQNELSKAIKKRELRLKNYSAFVEKVLGSKK